MTDQELVQRLIPTGSPRVPLYLAPAKIEQEYVQRVTAVTELNASFRKAGKLAGNLFGFLGGDVTKEAGLAGRIAVSPLLQAIVLERAARESGQLNNLASTRPEPGKVLRYVGPARFVGINVEPATGVAGLSEDAAPIVAQRRKLQEEILRFRDDKVRTVVLVFEANATS